MKKKSAEIKINKDNLSKLAIEAWRLWRNTEKMENQPGTMNLRYSARKLKEELEAVGITFIDLTGQEYDAGMALDILETEENGTQTANTISIKEMVTPVILWKNTLLCHGTANLLKGPVSSPREEGRITRE